MKTYELYPWKIRVDKEKSKYYYLEHDLSENKAINDSFFEILDKSTSNFLLEFGIKKDKIKVKIMPAFQGADEACYIVEFMFCGEIYEIPSDQWDFYFTQIDDGEPIFRVDESTPKKVLVSEGLNSYQQEDKMGVYRFSPGAAYDENLKNWNSGYIYCKAIFKI
ncbi:hypothetical protein SAMN02910327_00228 [Peptostreptococcaceae bacterium pGA-8]|nr:hypothetical protein SAMN02910327_00228 [Peptostreptococcaceae bacterium pGA-8]